MKKKHIWMVLLIIVSSIFLYGCEEQQNSETLLPPTDYDLNEINEEINFVANSNNKFALDLYSEYKTEDGNIFFSPYSISTALAMTYEGAKGQTKKEMQKVFYFSEDDDLRRLAFQELYNEINKEDKEYKLSTANALWAQEDFKFVDEYFNVVEDYYGGKVTNLDFKKDLEGSRLIINEWVEDQTNDKIKDLIPQGILNDYTRLVLTNAIYFKGEWIKQFNESDTEERDFKITADETVKVNMMQRTDDEAVFNYAENDKLQILELPYSGNELSMLILLPKNEMADIEDSFTSDKLMQWKNDLKETRINIFIPRFKFETKYMMATTLKEMGMPTAFSGGSADFSGMSLEKLHIDQVIHQAFVEVNEVGTEAAAATAVIMVETTAVSPPMPEFVVDHPFVFIIQDKTNGNILFLGRVNNPAE